MLSLCFFGSQFLTASVNWEETQKCMFVSPMPLHPIALYTHVVTTLATFTFCFHRIGRFTSGWENNAIPVYCEYHVCYNQSPGNAPFPCPTLFCNTARNTIRTNPVGGWSHTFIWSLQTMATTGGRLTSTEGWLKLKYAYTFIWIYIKKHISLLFCVKCLQATVLECFGKFICYRIDLRYLGKCFWGTFYKNLRGRNGDIWQSCSRQI